MNLLHKDIKDLRRVETGCIHLRNGGTLAGIVCVAGLTAIFSSSATDTTINTATFSCFVLSLAAHGIDRLVKNTVANELRKGKQTPKPPAR